MMIKGDTYTSRVDNCFKILEELFTNYPRSIDEIEEDLISAIEFYRDLDSYIPQEKIEPKLIKYVVLPAVMREPLALDLGD